MPDPGRLCLAAAAAALLVALFAPAWRRMLSGAAALLLAAATGLLAAAFLTDDFARHLVWLYSAPAVPWYLKLSNVWGSDEGTLLLLTTLIALLSVPMSRRAGWAGPGALAMALFFAAGALIWDPFAPTPAAALAQAPFRGMNAHLVHVWMAFHPPFLFAAYALFLAPIGAMAEALARGTGGWRPVADWTVRAGWWTLSLGLALGMWWAYEDFTFGQIWHWDPVQTSVFVVWALATAHIHCLRRYRPDGPFRWTHPLLGLATIVAAFGSLAVTRSPVLASSHRYIGETSLPFLLTGLAAGLAVGIVALAFGLRRRRGAQAADRQGWLLRIGVYGFVLCALVAAGQIARAYISADQGLPRPPDLQPFFEMLTRWAPAAEMQGLRDAFGQWDVDGRAVNLWLTPLGILAGLLIGHNFLPLRRRAGRWTVTVAAALGIALVSFGIKPFDDLFSGGGMVSSRTIANFRGLECLVGALAYAGTAMLWWTGRVLSMRMRAGPRFGYAVPVGMVHFGISLALCAAVAATVFDTYVQRVVPFPPEAGTPIRFPGGYEVAVQVQPQALPDDGGRGGYRGVARVRWSLTDQGRIVEQATGHTLYRDDRAGGAAERGPMRLMCEILDYRYARHVSDAKHMIHPFIHRGLWRDVQLWFPVVPTGGSGAATTDVPVVLKIYPLMSWLWVGLGAALGGGLLILAYQAVRLPGRRRRRRPAPVTPAKRGPQADPPAAREAR